MAQREIRHQVRGQIEIPGSTPENVRLTGDIVKLGGRIGDWTPTYVPITTGFDAITYGSSTNGAFLRYGDLVYIRAFVSTDSLTLGSAAGGISVQGLPFSIGATDGPANTGSCQIYATGFAGDYPSEGLFISTTDPTRINLYYRTTANAASTSLDPSDMTTGASTNANQIRFSAVYFTDDP